MTRWLKLFVCVAAMFPIGSASAQDPTDQPADQPNDQPTVTESSASSPVAFVFVSRPTHIDSFAAASSGKLTPAPGSPFLGKIYGMSVNSKYLFGASNDGTDLYTFSIGSKGSLAPVSVINAASYDNPGDSGRARPTEIDTQGKTLYTQVRNNDLDESFVQSFRIEANGDLQYLGRSSEGSIPADVIAYPPPVFLGTGKSAYQVSCVGAEEGSGAELVQYQRESNGLLTDIGGYLDLPTKKHSSYQYCTLLAATDPTDHVAMALAILDNETEEGAGFVLATYTAQSGGKLTTRSTWEDMPMTPIVAGSMSISPSGKLLAVGGQGFQIFHFNGSDPITHYTGVFDKSEQFLEFGWDKENHLYALSSNYLHVYTVTPTSIKEASGSPYSIPEASSVIVLSLKK